MCGRLIKMTTCGELEVGPVVQYSNAKQFLGLEEVGGRRVNGNDFIY